MKRGCATLGALALVTILSWLLSEPVAPMSHSGEVSQVLGGLALVGFACLMVMSTRLAFLDVVFNGLDTVYVVHKWLGIASVGLVLAHLATIEPNRSRGAESAATQLGTLSLVLFVVLTLIALRTQTRTYESWKVVHRFMAVPYAVGLVHYAGASPYDALSLQPFSLWMALVAALGVTAAIYSIFVYERTGFPHVYRITSLRRVADRTVELTGRATSRPLPCRPGQFAFTKLPGRQFGSHPFTISRAGDGEIQFTIKALGDHTSLLVDGVLSGDGQDGGVRVGDTLVTSRAHGRFDYTTGTRQQIWIAGGIGITPFRSFVRAGVPEEYSIDLFYAFRGGAEGPYLDELASLAAPHVRVHPIDSLNGDHLTAATICGVVSLTSPADVYFCGPKAMRETLKATLPADSVKRFHFEEFQFGR